MEMMFPTAGSGGLENADKPTKKEKKPKFGSFKTMGLSPNVYKGVLRKGYKIPTPIQRKTIPLLMAGGDVVAMARTGSGKTAAFLLPMLERLKQHSEKVGARAVVLAPTRELALQTLKAFKQLGKYTTLRSCLLVGGDSMEQQFADLATNPDVLIATPGRLMHHLAEVGMTLKSVEMIVFDEADRLFEMGFAEQLKEIIDSLPDSRQTALFSATLPQLLVDFARAGLSNPTLVRLDADTKVSENLKNMFMLTRLEEKPAALLYLLRYIIDPVQQTIVFVATRHHVEYLSELLLLPGLALPCSCIYGSMDQTARKISLAKFRSGQTKVLLVTDVAARGIDIPLLDNVINYDFPPKPKLFVHRVGRTARAGRSGTAYSLVAIDELPYMLDLMLFLGVQPRDAVEPGAEYDEADVFYGRLVQEALDDQLEFIRHHQHHTAAADLAALEKVTLNAYKLYHKTRAQPSSQSVKRAKELPTDRIHPYILKHSSRLQLERSDMVAQMKSFRPRQTIFEIDVTKKAGAAAVMRTKRDFHKQVISTNKLKKSFESQLDEVMADQRSSSTGGPAEPQQRHQDDDDADADGGGHDDDDDDEEFGDAADDNDDSGEGGADGGESDGSSDGSDGSEAEVDVSGAADVDDDMEDAAAVPPRATTSAASSVRGLVDQQRRLNRLAEVARAKRQSFRDEQFYMQPLPPNHFTEKMLSVNDGGGGLAASDLALDLNDDETQTMDRNRRVQKWDRKHKKFVSVQAGVDPNAKRKTKMLRNEAGQLVSATERGKIYEQWKHKNKVEIQRAGELEDRSVTGRFMGGSQQGRFFHRYHQHGAGGASSKQHGEPAAGGKAHGKVSRKAGAVKSKEIIIKERKQVEKQKAKQKGFKKGRGGGGRGGGKPGKGGKGGFGGGQKRPAPGGGGGGKKKSGGPPSKRARR